MICLAGLDLATYVSCLQHKLLCLPTNAHMRREQNPEKTTFLPTYISAGHSYKLGFLTLSLLFCGVGAGVGVVVDVACMLLL